MEEAIISREASLEALEKLNQTGEKLLANLRIEKKEFQIYLAVKRLFDILVALAGLIISAPLWLIIMIAIKLTSRGPIFYFQERYGKEGKIFKQWKFRSMVHNAEQLTGPILASERDPRITRIGWILRKTAMDELPQLINILLGDMSFVGPRPERPCLVDNEILEKVPEFNRRHIIRPGLTGLAQVFGRYNTSPRDKLRYDLLYIQNLCLTLDLKLLLLSFWITFRAKWQDRGKKI